MLEVFAAPFIAPAMDGRWALEVDNTGWAIESRLALLPAIDGLGVLEGVVVRDVLSDDPVIESCFVGDLLGDYLLQYLHVLFRLKRGYVPLSVSVKHRLRLGWDCRH